MAGLLGSCSLGADENAGGGVDTERSDSRPGATADGRGQQGGGEQGSGNRSPNDGTVGARPTPGVAALGVPLPEDVAVPGLDAAQVVLPATAEEADEIQSQQLPADGPSSIDEQVEQAGSDDPLPPVGFDRGAGLVCADLELALVAAERGDGNDSLGHLERARQRLDGTSTSTVIAGVEGLPDSAGEVTPEAIEGALGECIDLGYER